MLQLLDLARENAALKCELTRIRREAEGLRLHLSIVCQTWAECSCADSTMSGASPGVRDTHHVKERGRYSP